MERNKSDRETYHTTYYARPPRIAIFFDSEVREWDSWQSYFRRLIGVSSENWGGFQFIFIPYDGGIIEEPWLSLLRAYDPDYIASYIITMADFRDERPDEFKKHVEKTIEDSNIKDSDPVNIEQEVSQKRILDSWRASAEDPFFSIKTMDQLENTISTFIKTKEGSTRFNRRTPCLSISNPVAGTSFESIAWWNCQTPSYGGSVKIPNISGEDEHFDLWKTVQWGSFNTMPVDERSPSRPDVMEEYPLNDDCFKNMFKCFFIGWNSSPNSHVEDSPFFLSGFDLQERKLKSDIRYPYKDGTITVVFGSDFMDFCFYFNLARLRPYVIWCPDEENNQLTEVYSDVLLNTTNQAKFSERVNLTSISYEHKQAREKASSLGYIPEENDAIHRSSIWHEDRDTEWVEPDNLVIPSARRRFLEKNSFGEHFGPYFDGISGTPIIPPVPKSQKEISVTESAWISDYISKGFQPPSRTSISKMLADPESSDHLEKGVNEEDVRIGSDGECRSNPKGILHWDIPVHEWITQTQLIRPDDVQIFRSLFREYGYETTLSDKGRYEREAMRIFEGLENCVEYITGEDYVELFDAFTANEDDGDEYAHTGRDIVNGNGNILSLKSIRKDDNGPQLQNAEDLIDDLISYEAVERGFSLGCERCGRTDWYAVGEVNDSFTCHFCGESQVYQRTHFNPEPHGGDLDDDPIFFYRLNEMIAQMWRHDGYLPLRTIHKLKKVADHLNGGFHYHLEFSVDKFNGKKNSGLIPLPDRGLVFGECEKSEEESVSIKFGHFAHVVSNEKQHEQFIRNEFDFLVSLDGYLILGECKAVEDEDESVSMPKRENEEGQYGRILRLAEEINADFVLYCTDGSYWKCDFKNKVQEDLSGKRSSPLFYSQADLQKEPSESVDDLISTLSSVERE